MKNDIKEFNSLLLKYKLRIKEHFNSHPTFHSEIYDNKLIYELSLFRCYPLNSNEFTLPSYLYYGLKKLKNKNLEDF